MEKLSLPKLWDAEYAAQGLPSSVRATPSGAVVWAVGQLREHNCRLRSVVDVGCGKGRNSLYLATQGMQVTALDFTANAVAELHKEAVERHLDDKIRAAVHDVTEPWPVPDDSIDLVVDAFCFKHIAPSELRRAYKANLLRALCVRGHYMISFASVGDGYYGRYKQGGDEDEAMIVDPANGIESVLFSRKRVLQFFAPELDLFAEIKHAKPSVIHGQTFDRETYALLFKRNPRHFVG